MAPYPYDDETVFSRFWAMATSRPAQPFLRVLPDVAKAYGCASGDISYGDMASQVAARRDVLAAAGLPVGARIGLYLFNTPDFFVNWLAANALGLSIVPINPDLKRRETDFIIAHSDMALMVANGQAPQILRDICSDSGLPLIGPAEAPPKLHVIADGLSGPQSRCEAALLYTSGTTGQPKGCQLDQVYFLTAGDWYAALPAPYDLRPGEEVMLTPLPMFHMNALAFSVMAMITTGGTLVPLDRFHPSRWTDAVRNSQATTPSTATLAPQIAAIHARRRHRGARSASRGGPFIAARARISAFAFAHLETPSGSARAGASASSGGGFPAGEPHTCLAGPLGG